MSYLGVDIGGTNVDFVLCMQNSGDGYEFEHIASFKTQDVIGDVSNLIESLAEENDVEGVGVGVACWIKEGVMYRAPNLPKIPELRREWVIENDANCFAFYSSKVFGYRDLLALTVGTGIGTGVIVNGEIYRGKGLAGELGHAYVGGDRMCVCGRRGHLETHFSGWVIKKERGRELEEEEIYKLSGFDVFCRTIAISVMVMDFPAVVVGGRIGSKLDENVIKSRTEKYLMQEFIPEFKVLRDEFAVAKGSALLAKHIADLR
jgi:glucokinase/N-acetylglucosamine kinase